MSRWSSSSPRLASGFLTAGYRVCHQVGDRGFFYMSAAAARILPDRNVTVRTPTGASLVIPGRDPYWLRLAARGFEYEPEVGRALDRVARESEPFFFIDGGANIGYWSAEVLSGATPRAMATVAIEPNPMLLPFLRQNLSIFGTRATVYATGLGSRSGVASLITPSGHAGARLESGGRGPKVSVTALDDFDLEIGGHHVVLKLDVEGAEGQTLAGAGGLLERHRPTVLYEEHGADPTHSTTQAILERLVDYDLHFLDPRTLDRIPVGSVAALDQLKKRPSYGYNCLATPKR